MTAIPPDHGRSWWLREALAQPEFAGDPCPPLTADATADVVILGGGYTGMWTAWFLKELDPGIDVVLLEPGLITTEFGEAAAASMDANRGTASDPADPYASFNTAVGTVSKGAYEGPLRRLGAGPDRVAKVIERALNRRRPRARVTITPSAKLTIAMRSVMSDRAWDAAMRMQFPQPR